MLRSIGSIVLLLGSSVLIGACGGHTDTSDLSRTASRQQADDDNDDNDDGPSSPSQEANRGESSKGSQKSGSAATTPSVNNARASGDRCNVGTDTTIDCVKSDGRAGTMQCGYDQGSSSSGGSQATWGTCIADGESDPKRPENTPLVFAFKSERVQFTSNDGAAAAAFDLAGREMSIGMDWPSTSTTPWLALDRNNNGRIDDGSELFGSAVRLSSSGRFAPNGFVALAELDEDGDGRITPNDAAFARLVLWFDHDNNRISSTGELQSLASAGIESIDLSYSASRQCDVRGNCEIERATFRYAGGQVGAVIDVHLRSR